MTIKKSYVINLIEYIFVLVLVLNCRSIWTSMVNVSDAFNTMLRVLLIVLTGCYVFLYGLTMRLFKRFLALLTISIFYFLIYLIAVNYNVRGLLYLIITMCATYLFTNIIAENNRGIKVLCKYENLIILIAVVSLFFWLFGSLLGIIHNSGVVESTWSSTGLAKSVKSYYGIYFETQKTLGIIRNTAIFTEAPMYNVHLCIAFLIEIFLKSDISKKKCIILIVTILSTISTTGYCILAISFVLKYIMSSSSKKIFRAIKWALLPTVFVAGALLVVYLIMDKLGTSSGSTRLDDYVTGYKVWMTSPIFGVGYGNMNMLRSYMSSWRTSIGFSNAPMQILSYGGIVMFFPYAYFTFRWLRLCISERRLDVGCFFLGFLFIFALSLIPFQFITFFILFSYVFWKPRREHLKIEPTQKSRLISNENT